MFDLIEGEETLDLRNYRRIHGRGVEFRNYLAVGAGVEGLEVVERTQRPGKAYNVSQR